MYLFLEGYMVGIVNVTKREENQYKNGFAKDQK